MARSLSCDICQRPCERIVAKLHRIPAGNGPISHSNYSHHADVGECCDERVLELFRFSPRMTRKEYNQKRKGIPVVK